MLKRIAQLLKIEAEISSINLLNRTEKQIERLELTQKELHLIDSRNSGIVNHVKTDILQGKKFKGKKGKVVATKFMKEKLLPFAKETKSGLIVNGQDISKLNKNGAGIGSNTLISLKENKLCKTIDAGRLILPWSILSNKTILVKSI